MAEADSGYATFDDKGEDIEKNNSDDDDDDEGHCNAAIQFYAIKKGDTLPRRWPRKGCSVMLASTKRVIIGARSWQVIPFGFKLVLPRGTCGRIEIRTELVENAGLFISGGIVERDYVDELQAVVFNYSDAGYEVDLGEEIAKLIIQPVLKPCIWELMDDPSMENMNGLDALKLAYWQE